VEGLTRATDARREEKALGTLVAEHARRDPQRRAIEDGDRRFSYGELDAAATAIAEELVLAGAVPEEPVAVCLPRSWEAVASLLGVLYAGAAYVPISPAYPPMRQRTMVELAGIRIAISDAAHGRRLPGGLLRLDAMALANARPQAVNGQPPARQPGAPRADGLAYVMFTSGSTGRPKGVEITHRNLTNLVCSQADVVPRGDDAVLQVIPLEFDGSGLEIWGALVSGARLVLAPDGRPDPHALGRLITSRGVTFLVASAGVFHELVRVALPDLAELRVVVSAGDVLSPLAARSLREAHPGVRLINGYGPTEATILASSFEVCDPDHGPVPIGRPLPGYELYVLDAGQGVVDPGEAGELWIGGAGVARGYRRHPELTSERFRPDPFAGGTMYMTGDRVRLRDDGELLFLGRIDRQVKVAGQRVELPEIEQVLEAHPGVREAAVGIEEAVAGHRQIVACVVPAADHAPTPPELRAFLEQRLPGYMVPSRFSTIDALPLTDRGKVDHAALQRRGSRPAGAGSRHTGTTSATAERIAAVMAELLGLDSVRVDENLFDLGADSLLAIGLVGLLRERLGAELDIGTVFDYPTAEALSDRIEVRPGRTRSRPRLLPGPPRTSAPLSFAQRRAWLFGRMHPDSIAYQFASLIRLSGDLDRGALAAALADLIARHEILRTSFAEVSDEPRALIQESVPLPLEVIDLRGSSPAAQARLIRQRVRTRIDPTQAPLVRWTLIRLGDGNWGLVHVEHHLVHDGWSFAVLLGELSELYSARAVSRSPALTEPQVQFQDYARWERELVKSDLVAAQLDYWVRTLDPNPPLLEFPADRARGARESFTGSSVRRRMEPEAVAALSTAARSAGVTVFMASFAAFAALAHRHTGSQEVQIGSGVANRTEPASRQLLGMIVNTVVLRVDLSGDPTVAELLRRVRRVALQAYANADAPIDAVVDAVNPPRDPSRSPLFNVLFSFHDSPRFGEHWEGLRVRLAQGLPNGSAKADLNVIGVDNHDGGMTFVWERSDLFSDATVDRLAGQHLTAMAQLASRPDARLSELDLISEDERQRLAAWSGRAGRGPEYEPKATVPALFAARAAEHPEAPAVTFASETVSYASLERRANRLAHHLRERGIQPGDRVGVALERSIDLIVALLAIVKAGAAYVPLDPRDPKARLERLAASSQIAWIVTLTRWRDQAPVVPSRIISLEELIDLARHPDTAPDAAADAMDAAYVMFTSGSTGPPRAVVVPHRAIVRLVRGADYVRLDPEQTILGFAPPSFDASTFEIWGALLNGGRLVLAPPGPLALSELEEVIMGQGVTTAWLTAGMFHRVVDDRPELLRSLRQLLAGGDVLSPAHVRRALDALPDGGVLINGYGPTEATTFSCVHRMVPGDVVDGPVPIGRPVPGTTAQVLDDAGREVPIGVAGELFIGGDGVALGFSGDPDATRQRFLQDPFSPDGRGRMYRTGDRVRWRPDGTLAFLGRADRQMKIRGFRIEPGEIEETVRRHPAVADAHVEAFKREAGGRSLVAYVVPGAGAGPTVSELRAHAGLTLAAYAVPSEWVLLDELPLGSTGKIDAAKLPAPQQNLENKAGGRRRRRGDPLERTLLPIWERLLGRDGLDVDDDFFDAGGHSLLAVELFTAIEDELGKNLPLATIFEAPTVSQLAAVIRRDGWKDAKRSLVAVKRGGHKPPVFCVCAGDGNATGFAALARRLPDDQPVYALQPRGLNGNAPLQTSVTAAAKHYIRQLRRLQPHGPYLLAGRCLGASIAYEMARRLTASGQEVGLLAALDSGGPLWQQRLLPDGTPFDEAMFRAVRRARTDLDPFSWPGCIELLRWLAESDEDAPSINRYVAEVYRMREDARDAFPELDGLGGEAFIAWCWTYGRTQHALCPGLLPRPPEWMPSSESEQRTRRDRLDETVDRLVWRLEEAADILSVGRRRGAAGRQRRRVLDANLRASDAYRAGRYGGTVTLVRSQEYREHMLLDRWYALDTAGVVEVEVAGNHRSMMRDPDVASLAERLQELIDAAAV
jgi:amino acid adenylation domain-containing protein